MKHPDRATLALRAGGDLSPWKNWRTGRHLENCEQCRDQVAAFEDLRNFTATFECVPDIAWNRLAAEMTANIRLGLEAGECVRPALPAARVGWRAAVAMASIAALAVTGLMLERPGRPGNQPSPAAKEDTAVQTAPDGIGGQQLKLMNRGAQNVTLSAGAEGSVRSRYTDPVTGYMTVSQVDAQ